MVSPKPPAIGACALDCNSNRAVRALSVILESKNTVLPTPLANPPLLRYSNSQALKKRFPSSAAPCRCVKQRTNSCTHSRGGLPPPPSSAGLRHSTDPARTLPMDCPWTAHGLPTDCPWTAHGNARLPLVRVLGLSLGVFSVSFSV